MQLFILYCAVVYSVKVNITIVAILFLQEFVEASKYPMYRTLDVLEQELNALTDEVDTDDKNDENKP